MSDSATVTTNIKIEYALGNWWVNVYVEGFIHPVAGFGPCDYDQATRTKHALKEHIHRETKARLERDLQGFEVPVERTIGNTRITRLVGQHPNVALRRPEKSETINR